MRLLGRLLSSQRSKAYAEGLALLEDGRFGEAIEKLRVAADGKADSLSGSLASFHFRHALVAEGKRLLRLGSAAAALEPLSEAAARWDRYPDLHCYCGTASGLSGDWETALASAKAALRLNPDYPEARLLEALARMNLGQVEEAVRSLNSLVESGRRQDHWLISRLQRDGQYTGADLPTDLSDLLQQVICGESEKEEIRSAVTLCRAGRWQEGLERFHSLVQKRPRYPDYRVRYAASLFQLRRNAEALVEVDAALALNDQYRTAVDLKGLILADSGSLIEAKEFLAGTDAALDQAAAFNAHEELFGAYLRGVLALLTGDLDAVAGFLANWPRLGSSFARAELLLAAADDLRDKTAACRQRLQALVAEWPGEGDYFFLLACHHLQFRNYGEVADLLSRWPADRQQAEDLRPLFLESCLAVCQGRVPSLPAEPPAGAANGPALAMAPESAAWEFLQARSSFLQGDDDGCWRICRDLQQRIGTTERLLRLQIGSARGAGPGAAGWTPAGVVPDSCLPEAVFLHHGESRWQEARTLVENHQILHPDCLLSWWLATGFWLDPIRSWIA